MLMAPSVPSKTKQSLNAQYWIDVLIRQIFKTNQIEILESKLIEWLRQFLHWKCVSKLNKVGHHEKLFENFCKNQEWIL